MIYKILEQIANESGSNKKLEILNRHKDNKLLKRVLELAYSKRIKFYIKEIPDYKPRKGEGRDSLNDAGNCLKILSARVLTGNKAVGYLQALLENLSEQDASIIERIIARDLRIGMGTTQINKIFPGLIPTTAYMGARAFNKEDVEALLEEGPCYSQIKMDGKYINAIIRNGEVDLESRAGEPNTMPMYAFVKELAQFPDCVLNGELTIPGIHRYKSNGIINSLVSIEKKRSTGLRVIKEIEKFNAEHGEDGYRKMRDRIVYTVWDMIEVEEYFDGYSMHDTVSRLNQLTNTIADLGCKNVQLILTKKVTTYEQAVKHFREVLAKGEEGTILKRINGKWESGKPKWQLKFKLEMDIDLEIVEGHLGTGKNSKVISAITCTSADGKLITTPAGMDEKTMRYATRNMKKLKGTILELTCSGVSQNEAGEYSVLHPRFKMFRDDKKRANTLREILQIEKGIKSL